ncbi:MAG: hypothetical protein QNJ98_15555 [Planctomycetota bacterium]|nr:hypothetical protein [Planctomycetota bacterium]
MAKRLEGEPFHLLATHCQNDTKANVVAYIRSQGLAEDTPNMTVSSFGGHPGVEGNGSVPYYMVFDHTGKLRRQHMCGAYHGGDGLGMIEWVDRLLEEAPAIWLGEEPFVHLKPLADQVASGKKLGAAALALETRPEGGDEAEAAEAKRLLDALTAWRDRHVAQAERLMATQPKEVLDAYGDLAKALKGSALAEPATSRIAELKGSAELKHSIALQKKLEKAKKKIDKLDVPKEAKKRGLKAFSLDDPACRKAHAKTLAKAAERLRKAIAEHADLPIAKTIEAYAKRLEG